jgi:hypothetical protein
MASKLFYTNIDLKGNRLYNVVLHDQNGTAGLGTTAGTLYYDTGTSKFNFREGSSWVTYYTSSTPLNSITIPTGSVNLNSQKITNLAYPTADGDAANKKYVDDIVAGIDWKQSVKYTNTDATTLKDMFSSFTAGTVTEVANLGGYAHTITITTSTTWSSTPTWQGQTWSSGDRILVRNQAAMTSPTVPANAGNGIYTISAQPTSGSAGAIVLTRATDADDATNNTGSGNLYELAAGAAVYVEAGTNAGVSYVLTTSGTITLGTTPQTWTAFTGAQSFTWSSGLTSSGNTISVNLDSSPSGLKFNSAKLAVDPSQLWIGSTNVALASTAPSGFTLSGIDQVGALSTLVFRNTGNSNIQSSTRATSGAGYALNIVGNGANTSGAGGYVYIFGGNGAGTNQNGGRVVIDGGTPTGTGNSIVAIGGASTAVQIGQSTVSTTTISGTTALADLASATGTAFVKWDSTSKVLSYDSTSYAALSASNAFTGANTFTNATGQTFRYGASTDGILVAPANNGNNSYNVTVTTAALSANRTATFPNSTGTVAIKASNSGSITLVANTAYAITHSLNTQYVLTQIFDSSWSQVEMDVVNTNATTVTVTSTVGGTFYYVIIG